MADEPAADLVARYRQHARHGFTLRENEGVHFCSVPSIDETGRFVYVFTTRLGGVSDGCFESLNLSVTRETNQCNKKENYQRAARSAGVAPGSLVLVNYAHGTGIESVTAANCGEGLSRETTLGPCDALVVREPGVTALTLHADCVPIVVADPTRGAGAVAHAGWKGTLGGLPEKLVRQMANDAGGSAENLLCAVGPHIRSCCFEVGDDVAEMFSDAFGPCCVVQKENGRKSVDLEAAILVQFARAGVPPGNITLADECTFCEDELYYSHRRDHGATGAMGSLLAVLPDG